MAANTQNGEKSETHRNTVAVPGANLQPSGDLASQFPSSTHSEHVPTETPTNQSTKRREPRTEGLTVRSLRTFFLVTFGLSWGVGMLYTLFQPKFDAVFGSMGYTNPVFVLMVYAPGIVGVVMVWRRYGLSGLLSFFRRFTLWRMPKTWWLLLLVGIPAVYYAAAALMGNLTDPFPFTPWYTALPALLTMLFIGPIEELGWRGVALPLMQRRSARCGPP